MDQGIIQNINVQYRHLLVKCGLPAVEKKIPFEWTLLDTLSVLKDAWSKVKPTTIANCYTHCGLYLRIQRPRLQMIMMTQKMTSHWPRWLPTSVQAVLMLMMRPSTSSWKLMMMSPPLLPQLKMASSKKFSPVVRARRRKKMKRRRRPPSPTLVCSGNGVLVSSLPFHGVPPTACPPP